MSFGNPCAVCGDSNRHVTIEHYQLGSVTYCQDHALTEVPPSIWKALRDRRKKLDAAFEQRHMTDERRAARLLDAFAKKPRPLSASDTHKFINWHSYCAPLYYEGTMWTGDFSFGIAKGGPGGFGGESVTCPGCLWVCYPNARPRGMKEPK